MPLSLESWERVVDGLYEEAVFKAEAGKVEVDGVGRALGERRRGKTEEEVELAVEAGLEAAATTRLL